MNNLTPKQSIALESLTKNKNIVIMPSDKDGSIVVLDKEKYDKTCFDILMNTNYYEELNKNPDTSYKEKFTEEIQNLLHEKLITKNESNILLEGTETHLFMQNRKPIKPFKIFQYLDPCVMEQVLVLFTCQSLLIAFFNHLAEKTVYM